MNAKAPGRGLAENIYCNGLEDEPNRLGFTAQEVEQSVSSLTSKNGDEKSP